MFFFFLGTTIYESVFFFIARFNFTADYSIFKEPFILVVGHWPHHELFLFGVLCLKVSPSAEDFSGIDMRLGAVFLNVASFELDPGMFG